VEEETELEEQDPSPTVIVYEDKVQWKRDSVFMRVIV